MHHEQGIPVFSNAMRGQEILDAMHHEQGILISYNIHEQRILDVDTYVPRA